MFSGVPDSTVLSLKVVFSCQSKMAAGKQKFEPFLMLHYQPAVICQPWLGFGGLPTHWC